MTTRPSAGWSAIRTLGGRWSRRGPRWKSSTGGMRRAIEAALRAACEETGLKPRVLFSPVRVAVSGRSVAPGLFESLALLGRDETLARIATLGRRFTVEG